jgi:hypothetical protein
MEITKEQFESVKWKALTHFEKHRKVYSPIFWEIKIDTNWFKHIEWDSQNHKRPLKEAYIRYLCFLNFDYIIENSNLYQEYRETYEMIEVKWKKKRFKVNKLIKYYWLVAIVNNNQQRIKVIIKKIEWRDKLEYVSVVPRWKITKNWLVLYLNDDF